MSSMHEGGQHGPTPSRRPIGMAIAACLSAIVLAGLLAVVLVTGDDGEPKAKDRPNREKVVSNPADADKEAQQSEGQEQQTEQGQEQQTEQGQEQQQVEPTVPDNGFGDGEYLPCDPYDPACNGDYYDPLEEWPLDTWPGEEYDPYAYGDEYDPYAYGDEYDSSLDELFGAAA